MWSNFKTMTAMMPSELFCDRYQDDARFAAVDLKSS